MVGAAMLGRSDLVIRHPGVFLDDDHFDRVRGTVTVSGYVRLE